MKNVSKALALIIALFFFHDSIGQIKKKVTLYMNKPGLVNNSLVNTKYIFLIDKDSVSTKIYMDEKLFRKTVAENKPGDFTSDLLKLDLHGWQNLQNQSANINGCDTSWGLSVTYKFENEQKTFWITHTGNCFPDSLKNFAKSLFNLFKDE